MHHIIVTVHEIEFKLVKTIVEGVTSRFFVVTSHELVYVWGWRWAKTGITRELCFPIKLRLVLDLPDSEAVHRRSSNIAYVSPLLVLILYFARAHLLLEFFLEEVNFELQFLLQLLASSLFFHA